MKVIAALAFIFSISNTFAAYSYKYHCAADEKKFTMLLNEPVQNGDSIQETSGVILEGLKETDIRVLFDSRRNEILFFDNTKAPTPLSYSARISSSDFYFGRVLAGIIYFDYQEGDAPVEFFCSLFK
jgi:hypothetical protein